MALDQGNAVEPPADLAARKLTLKQIEVDPAWSRIGKTIHDPLFFSDSPGWRFSAKDMPGVLYVGDEAETCFWEVFWDDLMTRPEKDRRLDAAKVAERSVWVLSLPRKLHVVNTLEAATMHELSAPDGTFQGPYINCQRWARALRAHSDKPDGILYGSARRTGHRCLALFEERFKSDLWPTPGPGTPLLRSPELAQVVGKYGLSKVSS